MKDITRFKTPSPSTVENQQQADDLSSDLQIWKKPEVGQSHRLHCEKGPAEVVLPSPAEEVKPVAGAAETVLLYHHWIHPLHFNNCLVQLSYQIWSQKTTDCWANHWYNPPHSPGTVLIQSEQKGWKNHSVPLTSSTLPLRAVTVWSTLQSSSTRTNRISFFPQPIHLMNTWQ